MPYDLDLEKRLERLSAPLGSFTRKVMFGGVGYMLKGSMAFGIHKQSLLIRISPEAAEEMLKKDNISVFAMTGRPMKGWLLVSPEGLKSDKQLSDYLKLAVECAQNLPVK
jgi:TfoX/Sxy family transcriptional regulator of competence genes